jgi:hypothetical protein
MRKPSLDTIAPLLVGLAAIGCCALQSFAYGLPLPFVHDEFSYILAADTFRHGRLANPPHPLWEHFESMHILQQPTYASKYPPGQGLFLAAGWLLWHPILGVWLGLGLACGAATWMLRAYLPRWWAVCGGLLMASRMGFGEWGWSYWGGGVAAAGGALFIGGWARTLHRPRWLSSAVMAVGLMLLAISRPFEGLVLCLPVGMATVVWLVRSRRAAGEIVRQVFVPALAVLLPGALALGYYNYRVTGNALRLPYMEHAAQYDEAPVLLLQSPYPAPTYRHQELLEFHRSHEMYDYNSGRVYKYWQSRVRDRLREWWHAYMGYGLTLSLFALPCVLLQSPRTRFALASCIVVFGVVATLETWGLLHYTAPVAALLYLVIVQGFRRLALVRPWRPAGRRIVLAWITGCLLVPALGVSPWAVSPLNDKDAAEVPELVPAWMRRWVPPQLLNTAMDCLAHRRTEPWARVRSELEGELRKKGGRYLIVVQYAKDHSFHQEWVYNEADIDAAPVVWARPMGPEGVTRLANYFTDREIWLVDVDKGGFPGNPVLLRAAVRSHPGLPTSRR